jgi:hypothetical protein
MRLESYGLTPEQWMDFVGDGVRLIAESTSPLLSANVMALVSVSGEVKFIASGAVFDTAQEAMECHEMLVTSVVERVELMEQNEEKSIMSGML